MGIFSAWKASNAYENALKAYGVNPRSLTANLNQLICSYTNQEYEAVCNMVKDYRNQIPLEISMEQAAALVALCVIGPTNYLRFTPVHGITMNDTVLHAATTWREDGPEWSLNTKIIKTVRDAGFMHEEFSKAFNKML